MKKIISLAIAILVMTPMVFSQNITKQDREAKRHERTCKEYKERKYRFFEEELELTVKEKESFFKLYDKYDEERRAARSNKTKQMKELMEGVEDITDAQAVELLDLYFEREEDILKVKQKYRDLFSKVIPNNKIIKVYGLERQFASEMLRSHARRDNKDAKRGNRRVEKRRDRIHR